MNNQGRSLFFPTENGGEFIGKSNTNLYDCAGIQREYAAPGKPQENAMVESAIWRAMKGEYMASHEIRWPFQGSNSPESHK